MPAYDRDILEAALIGYAHQQKAIDTKIEEIKSRLGLRAKSSSPIEKTANGPRKKRKMSKEVRRKMAEAQKKRWAAVKKQAGNSLKG